MLHRRVFRRLQKVAEDGFVGVKADACVLQVDDDGVEVLQVFGLGTAVGVLCAVETDDLQAGCGIASWPMLVESFAPKMPCSGRRAWSARRRRRCRAAVDSSSPLRVEAGLVGQQADAQMAPLRAAAALSAAKFVASRTSMPVSTREACVLRHRSA